MEKTLHIEDAEYRKFQAALSWFKVDEDDLFKDFIKEFTEKFVADLLNTSPFNDSIEGNIKKGIVYSEKRNAGSKCIELSASTTQGKCSNVEEQRASFVAWFEGLKREGSGKPYSKRTISLYANRLANSCTDLTFEEIPVKNLFEVTSPSEFAAIRKQIKSCSGYKEYLKTAVGVILPSALQKYADFLQYQTEK